MQLDPSILQEVNNQPYPLLFVTLSGAHLYGFSSPDSDYDLRGCHILPLRDVLGLDKTRETVEAMFFNPSGLEIDIVTHDVKKYFNLLLKKNGYALEQIFSPLVVHTTPEHAELKQIAAQCITRHHSEHYLGFVTTQWKLVSKENPPRVKPLLYVFRVLLTGIWLMQTGEVEANLVTLNQQFKLSYIDELIARKIGGPEKARLDSDLTFYAQEYERLKQVLRAAADASNLPERPSPLAYAALNDLLVRLRLKGNE
jgi:uncharacterized protein